MSIRPVDLQVAVPKMAEADRMHKALEQPQHDQTFANEVKQMLARKEQEVQRQDDVQKALIRHRDNGEGQRQEQEQREGREREKKEKSKDGRAKVSDGLRGSKLDVRI